MLDQANVILVIYTVCQFQNFGFAIALKIEFRFKIQKNRFGKMEEEVVISGSTFLNYLLSGIATTTPKFKNCNSYYHVIPQFQGVCILRTKKIF